VATLFPLTGQARFQFYHAVSERNPLLSPRLHACRYVTTHCSVFNSHFQLIRCRIP